MSILILLLLIITSTLSYSQYNVNTVNLLESAGFGFNGIGPVIVKADTLNNRIITANTLSSSISVYDCNSKKLFNIPTGRRALQHLKNESMAINRTNGNIYLVADKSLIIADVKSKSAKTVETVLQFESVAIDETTGNAYVVGRESKDIGFYNIKESKLIMLKWLDFEEKLINMNQTPPPPIRKVINVISPILKNEKFKSRHSYIVALDGYTATLHIYDAQSNKLIHTRELSLSKGGRWHLAGVNEKYGFVYIVTETSKRRVDQAAKIDIFSNDDDIVKMPENFTEPAGITYNPDNDRIYIPYDNHPLVHQINFRSTEKVFEIKIPTFGNDASALDLKNQILYVGSWAVGEIYAISMTRNKFVKKLTDLGIIPHMFAMVYNPLTGKIYYPIGASAVNGTFGAAVTELNPITKEQNKIYTGWAPIDLIEIPNQNAFMIFNNEDMFVVIYQDLSALEFKLPYNFPITCHTGHDNLVYLSYGPHQSYWPVVYIWGAKNGILSIHPGTNAYYDRRIPRQAMQMVMSKSNKLFMTQNNWGKEPQFVNVLEDEIRYNDIGKRLIMQDSVERETTQRILKYDENANRLYLVRVAESDELPSILTIINPDSGKAEKVIEVGLNATDLVFDEQKIYISDFISNDITVIDKNNLTQTSIKTEMGPLKLVNFKSYIYVINHLSNSIQDITSNKTYKLPSSGMPDNIGPWKDKIIITSHSNNEITILSFDPATAKFETIYKDAYPFGDTRFDSQNSSFYMTGQFGDAVFSITQIRTDIEGRMWLTDFLSGRCYIVSK